MAGKYLMVMRYINGAWTSQFDPSAPLSDADRRAMDAADRSGLYREAIHAEAERQSGKRTPQTTSGEESPQ